MIQISLKERKFCQEKWTLLDIKGNFSNLNILISDFFI